MGGRHEQRELMGGSGYLRRERVGMVVRGGTGEAAGAQGRLCEPSVVGSLGKNQEPLGPGRALLYSTRLWCGTHIARRGPVAERLGLDHNE